MVNSGNDGSGLFVTPPICEDPCPANSICPNETDVFTKAGYSGLDGIRCFNPFACLEGSESAPFENCR